MILKTRIEHIDNHGIGSTRLITDFESITVRRGQSAQSNTFTMTLTNPIVDVFPTTFGSSTGTIPRRKHVNEDFSIKFQEFDIVKIYVKNVDFNQAIDTSSDSTDLLIVGDVQEWEHRSDSKNNKIIVSGIDKTYGMLNQLQTIAFNSPRLSGTATSTTANKLVDTGAFANETELVGAYVYNTTDDTFTRITAKDDDDTLSVADDIFASGETYTIHWNMPTAIQRLIRNATDNTVNKGFDSNGDTVTYGGYEIDVRTFTEGIKSTGTTDDTSTGKLIDSGATFQTDGVEQGDYVYNSTDSVYTSVYSVDSETQLTLVQDIFVSGEGYSVSDGFVQDFRVDGTVFPDIALSKLFKPVYEWINDFTETQNTNTSAELTGTIVQDRKMVFYIDERNRFHCFYPDDAEIDYTIVTDGASLDGDVRSVKLKKSTFDVINMVIFNSGKDLANIGTLDYYYNKSSRLNVLKMKYYPYLDISEDLKKKELDEGNITIGEDGTVTVGVTTGTTSWGESYVGSTDYKDAFRTRLIALGDLRAEAYTNKRSHPRYKGNITVTGKKYSTTRPRRAHAASDLLKFTDYSQGIYQQLLRIDSVTHNIDKKEWTSQLDVIEDEIKRGT